MALSLPRTRRLAGCAISVAHIRRLDGGCATADTLEDAQVWWNTFSHLSDRYSRPAS